MQNIAEKERKNSFGTNEGHCRLTVKAFWFSAFHVKSSIIHALDLDIGPVPVIFKEKIFVAEVADRVSKLDRIVVPGMVTVVPWWWVDALLPVAIINLEVQSMY